MASELVVDLNADLGEGFGAWRAGDDDGILELVTSASIACGFHAGDPLTMTACVRKAAERGVVIGAHVSYFDLRGFGRRFIDVAEAELTADVVYQIGALSGIARANGTSVRYVKAHGALYNTALVNEAHSRAIVDAVRSIDASLPVMTMAGSITARLAADAGLRVITEGFADRTYAPDGQLTDRRLRGALRHDPAAVAKAALEIVQDGVARTPAGDPVPVSARSLCIHGDSPTAKAAATAVRATLVAAGVALRAAV